MATAEQSAESLFRAGHLAEALAAQTAVVKKKPTDPNARFLLFVLLCYGGELERADKQLAVLADQDADAQEGALVYHTLLASEWERRKVYEADVRPALPPDSPEWAELRIQAFEKLRAGDAAGAEALIDQATEATPDFSGKLNGESFDDIRDYDDALGSIIEIFAGGRYLWMPISRIRSLTLEAPATALDTLWQPAKLEDSAGISADIHLPVLYQPSYANEHEAIRLGHMTDWREQGELYTGVGQHLYLAIRGDERVEQSLLDVRQLDIDETS